MSAISITARGLGKPAAKRAGANFPQVGETNRRVINAIKEMYENPAVLFGRWLGVTDKSAKRKLGLERSLSSEELGKLIRSERGFEVLEAIMGDAKPEWWRVIIPLKKHADVKLMQRAASRMAVKAIEEALDADRNLTAAIQHAEALQDQDHAGPYLDALRSVGRVQSRAMAPKGRVK